MQLANATDPTTIQHCNICDGASRAELSTYLGEPVCVDCIADHEADIAENGPPWCPVATVEIRDLDSGEVLTCALAHFVRDNEEDVDLCAEVAALGVGASIDAGGGAAPWVRVTRTA